MKRYFVLLLLFLRHISLPAQTSYTYYTEDITLSFTHDFFMDNNGGGRKEILYNILLKDKLNGLSYSGSCKWLEGAKSRDPRDSYGGWPGSFLLYIDNGCVYELYDNQIGDDKMTGAREECNNIKRYRALTFTKYQKENSKPIPDKQNEVDKLPESIREALRSESY